MLKNSYPAYPSILYSQKRGVPKPSSNTNHLGVLQKTPAWTLRKIAANPFYDFWNILHPVVKSYSANLPWLCICLWNHNSAVWKFQLLGPRREWPARSIRPTRDCPVGTMKSLMVAQLTVIMTTVNDGQTWLAMGSLVFSEGQPLDEALVGSQFWWGIVWNVPFFLG